MIDAAAMDATDGTSSFQKDSSMFEEYSFDHEEECRVCRGPAEEGQPLFSPCKCSGSIGLTHQECLSSWLKVQRGDGRCELCGYKFRFAPQYAEGAPEHLPFRDIILGISRSAFAKWLPLVMRIVVATALWLLFVPLATAYSYIGWLHSPSTISKRFEWELVVSDTISGAIIAGIIIVSFLSLMSFADFLRFNFRRGRQNQNQVQTQNNNDNNIPPTDDEIDDVVTERNRCKRREQRIHYNLGHTLDETETDLSRSEARRMRFEKEMGSEEDMEGLIENDSSVRATMQQRHFDTLEQVINQEEEEEVEGDGNLELEDEDAARLDDFLRDMEDDDVNDEDAEDEIPPMQNNPEPAFPPRDPAANQDDMEMNLALDELLGLRGPVGALMRNISWLMAFNITYLGLFAFLPRFVGATVFQRFLNSTITSIMSHITLIKANEMTNTTNLGISELIEKLNFESQRHRRALQLNDIALLVLGYLSMAFLVVLIQVVVSLRRRMRPSDDTIFENVDDQDNQQGNEDHAVRNDPAMDEGNNFAGIAANDEAIEIRIPLGQFLSLALDCAGAFVKVGVLLFLKMLLLPLILGLWLDVATLRAFNSEPSNRILYAGNDLFSSLSIHWVVGITFMLLVTVSVLQLREVVHPSLFARMIRPQEPQPDLLGNLLSESGTTHAKRMVLSLAIYTFLLTVHIWLPSRILVSTGLDAYIPFLRPHLWYIVTPQLQVPLELLIFHLTMLGFLEKYKNNIGGLQHWWLITICKPLGLTNYLLPRKIERFLYIGSKRIFLPDSEKKEEVDLFWHELAARDGNVDDFIEARITLVSSPEESRYEQVQQRTNRRSTISGSKEYIRLPISTVEDESIPESLRKLSNSSGRDKNILLATTLGKYRLRRNKNNGDGMLVEFWKECDGDIIVRPPEGWDDLVAGGAEVQGRWAWGNESKSSIELGVAVRRNFFYHCNSKAKSVYLVCMVILVFVLSWVSITLLLIVSLSAPLTIGRMVMVLLRIPRSYIHDPAAFAIGLTGICNIVKVMSPVLQDYSGSIRIW
eukprot:CAMPEP_0194224826 /NCGR_PEP_ID=MMETSP0156-20130528/38247_1 /TAXON_ID=33649 /ORGANISM="Thalassionema nitzschioides, Strain L26-B" /LENGTH=1037 /DNA_ID=CAMNT_0038956545 /DNA_START=119 /DNA_END=3229 /DNA_ORIENTATION=-